MSFPSSIATLLIGLLFFVPGFLTIKMKRRLIALDKQSPFEWFMSALAASTVLVAFFECLSRLAANQAFLLPSRLDSNLPTTTFWVRYLALIGVALLVGMIWAWMLRKELSQRLFVALGFRVCVTPAPWDRVFGSDNEWIRVHLTDGRTVQGLKEYASAYPNDHEILLDRATLFDEDSNVITENTRMFVSGDQIGYIAVFPPAGKDDKQQASQMVSGQFWPKHRKEAG